MAPAGKSLFQAEFGGGIFRGRNAPRGSVYDAINALLTDERLLSRRGGSVFKSGSAADGTLLGLWEGFTVAGQRTLFWSATSPYVLDSNDSSIVDLGSEVPVALSTGVEIGGVVFFRGGLVSGQETEIVYAGSRKSAVYSTGTIAVTLGGRTVTGTGTAWLANVDAGMLIRFQTNNGSFVGVVKSVESDTSLTLVDPSVLTTGGLAYDALPIARYELENTAGVALLPKNPTTVAHAVAGQRLLRVRDNRVYFSAPRDDAAFLKKAGYIYPVPVQDENVDYHELPRGSLIIGADSLHDTAILFTTSGVWTIENMALDALDDFANRQRPVAQISQDLLLWGEAGIAGWAGQLVVPAIDDVYVMGVGGASVPVGGSVVPLYRAYAEAGYQPGLATVYRGHYFLPILDAGNAQVDTLVCRLDLRDSRGNARPAWTRWANHASGKACAVRVGAAARAPKLLGLAGTRVTDLTGCFSPSAAGKADADGTNHVMTVVTQDFESGTIPHSFTGAQVAMELVDAAADNPTFTVEHAAGPVETEVWVSAGSRGEGDGERAEAFRFSRRARAARLRIKTTGPAARAVLRSVEVFFRPRGRG